MAVQLPGPHNPTISDELLKSIKISPKAEQERLDKFKKKFKYEEKDTKHDMIDDAYQQLTEDQLKAIRRREYYSRRVKADFKPKTVQGEIPDDVSTPDEFDFGANGGEPLSPD